MPYDAISELPDTIQNSLPQHAKEIFLAAFNNAWEQYKSPEERYGNDSREEVSFKVAWSAVKNSYHKKNGRWIKNSD